MLIVYTGNGKGKTTAAWGLALRAAGRGKKVLVVSFMKPEESGEVLAITNSGLPISYLGGCISYNPALRQDHNYELAHDVRTLWAEVFDTLYALDFTKSPLSVLVLDELNDCLAYGYLTADDANALLTLAKDRAVEHVVITGRHAPHWLRERADIVTEMRCVKYEGMKDEPTLGIDW